MPRLVQTFELKDYLTEDFSRAHRAGEIFVIRDTQHDQRADAKAYEKLQIGAIVSIPFIWQGRWAAYFS